MQAHEQSPSMPERIPHLRLSIYGTIYVESAFWQGESLTLLSSLPKKGLQGTKKASREGRLQGFMVWMFYS